MSRKRVVWEESAWRAEPVRKEHAARNERPVRQEGAAWQEKATTYVWRYADEAGVAVDGPVVTFESRAAAEAWMADSYPRLLAEGITAVSLFDDRRALYGPMPLSA